MRTLDDPATGAHHGFGSVVCVAERSAHGPEAVRQAAQLAAGGGKLELVALAADPAPGRPRPQADQIEALVDATAVAAACGVHPSIQIDETSDEAAAVLARCRGRDLLVVPAGPLAAAVLPQAPIPVLVSRPSPAGGDLLDSVLIAVDGSPEAHDAARLGSRLAAHERAVIALIADPEHDARHQSALQEDVATVERATGRRPLVLDEYGAPAASIVQAAASLDATLIVLGSRPGRVVASVSAEVAQRAGCSVLVLRPGATAGRRGTTEAGPSSTRMRPGSAPPTVAG